MGMLASIPRYRSSAPRRSTNTRRYIQFQPPPASFPSFASVKLNCRFQDELVAETPLPDAPGVIVLCARKPRHQSESGKKVAQSLAQGRFGVAEAIEPNVHPIHNRQVTGRTTAPDAVMNWAEPKNAPATSKRCPGLMSSPAASSSPRARHEQPAVLDQQPALGQRLHQQRPTMRIGSRLVAV